MESYLTNSYDVEFGIMVDGSCKVVQEPFNKAAVYQVHHTESSITANLPQDLLPADQLRKGSWKCPSFN